MEVDTEAEIVDEVAIEEDHHQEVDIEEEVLDEGVVVDDIEVEEVIIEEDHRGHEDLGQEIQEEDTEGKVDIKSKSFKSSILNNMLLFT